MYANQKRIQIEIGGYKTNLIRNKGVALFKAGHKIQKPCEENAN